MDAQRISEQRTFAIGDIVRIRGDGDGADGIIAVVGNVYKSGRCRVDLRIGGFRNLSQTCLEAIMELNKLSTSVPQFWSYQTKPLHGNCRIDGAVMTVVVRVTRRRPAINVIAVPDVRDIDSAIAEFLLKPCIIEEVLSFCEAVFTPPEWECEVVGQTDSHGPLTVRNT